MDNMHYVVVHNALDHTSQQYFSDRAGTKTAVAKSHSYGTDGSGVTSVDNAYWFENNRMKALVASAD